AGQAAVGRDRDDPGAASVLAVLEQRHVRHGFGGVHRAASHHPDAASVWAQLLDPLLRTAEPRRGDHLHRAHDLLDVLDRRDTALDVLLAGYASPSEFASEASSASASAPSSALASASASSRGA